MKAKKKAGMKVYDKVKILFLLFNMFITMSAEARATYDVDEQGRTQLHWAAIVGDLELAKKSLAAGIEPELQDHTGKTAFDYAIVHNHLEVAAIIRPGVIQTEEINTGLPALALVGNSLGLSSSSLVAGAAIAAGTGIAVAASTSGGEEKDASSEHFPRLDDHTTPQTPEPSPTSPSPLQPTPPPIHPEIPEDKASWGLNAIGASSAYRYGLTGRGVVVAHLGEGVLKSHQELTGQLLDPSDAIISSEHSTESASIIVGKKDHKGMHGVAYESKLIPFYSEGSLSSVAAAHRISQIESVKVVHHDFTHIAQDELFDIAGLYRQWVTESAIIVVGAGDGGLDQPDNLGDLPHYDEALSSTWLTVVSLNHDYTISSHSNKCGAAKAWCLSAPGEELMVASAQGNDHYTQSHQSTTFAAAHVSGAAALLMQLYPQLTAQDVTALLFFSATDLGAPGIDEVYGYGLLNLTAALSPLGDLYIPNGKGQLSLFKNEPIKVGGAFGDRLVDHDIKLGMVDRLGRLFYIPLPYQVRNENFIEKVKLFYRQAVQEVTILKDEISGSQISLTMHETQGKIDIEQNNYGFAFYYNKPYESLLNYQDHPFLNLSDDTASCTSYFSLRANNKITFAAMSGKQFIGGLSKLEHRLDNIIMAWEVGALYEKSRILGNDFPNIVTSDYTTASHFIGVGGAIDITRKWQLYGEYYQGETDIYQESRQFSITSMGTQNINIGLVGRHIFFGEDELKISISEPLRVSKGYFSLLNQGAGENSFALQPLGKERDMELQYRFKQGKINFVSSAAYRHEPGHSIKRNDALELMTSISYNF